MIIGKQLTSLYTCSYKYSCRLTFLFLNALQHCKHAFVIFPFEESKVNDRSLMINKPQPLNHRLIIGTAHTKYGGVEHFCRP